MELKADFEGPAEGSVIEAHVDEGKGTVANILVQQGCLHQGDFIVAGKGFGRVRAMMNEHGEKIEEGMPSTPLQVLGLNQLPDAGDKFYVVKSLKEAESAAKDRIQQLRQSELKRDKITLDNIFDQMKIANQHELPVIVKGDVQGSIETLRSSIAKIGK